ncbi:hypothetical protein ACHQM5_006076 [Ranunculus cassubicifolius]
MASLIRLSSNNPTITFSSSSIQRKTCSNNGVKFKMSLGIHPTPRKQILQTSFHPPLPDLRVQKENLGFSGKKIGKNNKVWESEEDRDLEDDVLEFMKTARDPESFPTKEELIIGGRLDLVKRIIKQGGWLAFGWDLDDGVENSEDEILKKNNGVEEIAAVEGINGKFLKNDSRIFQNRFDTLKESRPEESKDSSALSINGSHQPSSSGRMEGEEDAGIGGILSRLQKERFRNFRVGAKGKQRKVYASGNGGEKEFTEVHGGDCNRVVQSSGNDFDDSVGMHAQSEAFSNCDDSVNPVKPDTWRKWSSRRAGYPEEDFEAAEFGEDFIRNDETVAEGTTGTHKLGTVVTTGDKVKHLNHIRSRLRYLESELDSVRDSLSYQTDMVVPDKTTEESREESHSLSDSSEFRETEIMKSKDKLRSLRAKLAVLEGKMALKIVDSQRMVNDKQKRIHYARKALNSLRTHCIVWPKEAKEVLLVGSFDGWTSKRRMEKTSPGIFSLFIRLYPGRYEIKFIVDGEWMIDPLRPTAPHWGYSNNILIISENE